MMAVTFIKNFKTKNQLKILYNYAENGVNYRIGTS